MLAENNLPDTKLRCCPKIAAGNKAGAKKKGKSIMGPLEKKKKKKNRIGNILEDDADLEVEEGEYYEDGKTGTV